MRHSNIAISVRLACVRHAANVHPEPGSNSPFDFTLETDKAFRLVFVTWLIGFCYSAVPIDCVLPSHSSVVKLRPRTLLCVKVVLSLLPVSVFVKANL